MFMEIQFSGHFLNIIFADIEIKFGIIVLQ
jgi:hypothetical protein